MATLLPTATFHSTRPSYGFSLIESAIVLGVVGLVIGSIWIAAANVTRKNNLERDYTLVVAGVEKVRALYKGMLCSGCSQSWQGSTSVDLGIVPRDLQHGTDTVSYSGYDLRLPQNVSNNGSIYSHGVMVTFGNVDKAGCIQLVSKFSSDSQTLYMWLMNESAGGYLDYSRNPADGAMNTLPTTGMAIAQAIASYRSCGEIGIIFPL